MLSGSDSQGREVKREVKGLISTGWINQPSLYPPEYLDLLCCCQRLLVAMTSWQSVCVGSMCVALRVFNEYFLCSLTL